MENSRINRGGNKNCYKEREKIIRRRQKKEERKGKKEVMDERNFWDII